MSWWKRHRLLAQMLRAPYSDYRASNDGREDHWRSGSASNGTSIIVVSEDATAKKAELHVNGQRICGASRLFKHLNRLNTGQWSWSQKRRLCRRLKSFEGEGWQCLLGGNGERYETEAYLSRELDGDMVRVYESGAVYVHDKPIMTSPGLYRTLDRQISWRAVEHHGDD